MWYNVINKQSRVAPKRAVILTALIASLMSIGTGVSAMASGIYVILNIQNGHFYIGQTQNFRKRLRDHKSYLIRGTHPNHHLQSAWNKYGERAFRFVELECCSIEQLDEREQYYLDLYAGKELCYNVATDAIAPKRGLTYTMSEETKQKIGNANRGRHLTVEHRQKLSDASKNISDEKRQKLSDSHKGKILSEETRKKMSTSGKNRPARSLETLHRMSEAQKGKKLSDKHKHKLSEAHKGKILSKEHKQKISESLKRQYALRKSIDD